MTSPSHTGHTAEKSAAAGIPSTQHPVTREGQTAPILELIRTSDPRNPILRNVGNELGSARHGISVQVSKEWSELIVTAVNSHQALLEALRTVTSKGEGMSGWAEAQDKAFAAIALATGKDAR